MTIQPDEEELHVIPNAGAPGTAGAGFRVIDRTGATDEEFQARVAVFDAAEAAPESFDAVAAVRRVKALADEFDANINWRDWGIGNRIRRALDPNPTPATVAHNHTRFRHVDGGPWSPCPVSCPAAGLLR